MNPSDRREVDSDPQRLRADAFRGVYARARRAVEELARRQNLSLRELAALLTADAERQFAGHLARFPLGSLACRPGCAYCCHVPRVLVTVPELAALAEAVRQLPPAAVEALRQRLDARADSDPPDAFVPAALPPCPLLVEGRCLVYDARPLVCRAEHSYDVAQCEMQFRTGDGHTLQCALVLDTTDGTLRGAVDGFRAAGLRGELLDLSRALRLVLERPEALDEWLAGGVSLMPATAGDP